MCSAIHLSLSLPPLFVRGPINLVGSLNVYMFQLFMLVIGVGEALYTNHKTNDIGVPLVLGKDK